MVSDIGMPGRDGYDLIREVRARGYSEDQLPAIALTALARPEDRQRALLAGFQLHVAKPHDAAKLTTAIMGLIGRTAQTIADPKPPPPQTEQSRNNGKGYGVTESRGSHWGVCKE